MSVIDRNFAERHGGVFDKEEYEEGDEVNLDIAISDKPITLSGGSMDEVLGKLRQLMASEGFHFRS